MNPTVPPSTAPSQSATASVLSTSSVSSNTNNTANTAMVIGVIVSVVIVAIAVIVLCLNKKQKASAYEIWNAHYNAPKIKNTQNQIDMHQIYSKENGPPFMPYVQRQERRKSRLSITQQHV
jgi:hypothetical protein